MLTNYDLIMNAVSERQRDNMEGQLDLFGGSSDSSESENLPIPYAEEYPKAKLLEMEKETLGTYVSGHPLLVYSAWLPACGASAIKKILDGCAELPAKYTDGSEVSIFAILRSKRMITTKKNQQMCFARFEDVSADMEVIVFPKVYESARGVLSENAALFVSGKISMKEEEPKILADRIIPAQEYISQLGSTPICVRLLSTDKDKVESLRRLCSEHTGLQACKLYAYLTDLGKLTLIKGASSLAVDTESLSQLYKICGAENVRFKPEKK